MTIIFVFFSSSLISPSQLVWAVNPQLNKRPQWQAATVKRNLGSMVYEVQLENGQTWKRHQNQLRSRCELTDQSSDLD
ncbi:unnamed protein product, partial [Rotaria magnacalcarata]